MFLLLKLPIKPTFEAEFLSQTRNSCVKYVTRKGRFDSVKLTLSGTRADGCDEHQVTIWTACELVKWETASVKMRPAMGKPTEEYRKYTNLQNLSTNLFELQNLSDQTSLPLEIM